MRWYGALAVVWLLGCQRRAVEPVAPARPDCAKFEALRAGKAPPIAGTAQEFWTELETCYAPPNASTCERGWTFASALPSMADPTPAELAKQKQAFLAVCPTLPEVVQRCLTAYAVGHLEECRGMKAREQLDAALAARATAAGR